MGKSPLKNEKGNSDNASSSSKLSGKSNVVVMPLNLTQPELSTGDLGTLQDILFGKQMAVHASQLLSLHSHMDECLVKLQERCDQQFADLHEKLNEGLRKVHVQIEKNDKKHIVQFSEITDNLGTAESGLMVQLEQASDIHRKAQVQLKSQLNESNEHLTSSIKNSHNELQQQLETSISELRSQKLDKGALSSLLGDVATQLTGHEKN